MPQNEQLGWVAANDGNVSVKLPDGNFICTPTGISKSFITPEKLIKINAKGEILKLTVITVLLLKLKCTSAVMNSGTTSALWFTLIRPLPPASPWPIFPWTATP